MCMLRGLSPIISALLLIVIAVVGGVLAYVFVSGFRPSPSASLSLLKVEGVGFEGGLVAYVRNVGESREVLDAVYIYDSSGRLVWHASGLGLALNPGGLARVPLNASGLIPGKVYTVQVAGTTGAVASLSFVYTGGVSSPPLPPPPPPTGGVPAVRLASRAAVYYDTFDTDPFGSGRLVALSCNWRYDGSGKLVYVSVTSRPSSYGGECIARVGGVSVEGKVYVAAVLSYTSTSQSSKDHFGLLLLDSGAGYFYEAGYTRPNFYKIWRYTGELSEIAKEPVGGTVDEGAWYDLAVAYEASRGSIEVWASGGLRVSASDPSVAVYSVGLGAYMDKGALTVYFDNLVVTVGARPWLVNVTGLQPGWTARVRVGSTVVSSAVAGSGGVASIPLWLSSVPGKDYAFIVRGAVLEILDSSGNVVAKMGPTDIVGGDVYAYG